MKYSKLEEGNSQLDLTLDGCDSDDGLLPQHQKFNADWSRVRLWQFAKLSVVLMWSTCVFLLGLFIGKYNIDLDSQCTLHVSRDSPLLNEIDINYSLQHFNGSLFKENVFRRVASPEVDAAWESLGVNYNSVALPEDYARQAGFRHDQVKINKKYGGGYPANVEGLHQLHCLNLVRQALYYNYDYYKKMGKGAFLNEDYVVKAHVSHCLDIVRQQLMCTVDIGFLGQVWKDPDYPSPFVDFNTVHKCRNFEAVRQWAEQHQLPSTDELADDFLEPPREGDLIYSEIP